MGEEVDFKIKCSECDRQNVITLDLTEVKIKWPEKKIDNKIKLSDAASSESADCEVIKGGDDMFDLISSSSHNLDAYSMASLGDYGGDFSSAEKGKNSSFCYTPSGKSQLKVKLL